MRALASPALTSGGHKPTAAAAATPQLGRAAQRAIRVGGLPGGSGTSGSPPVTAPAAPPALPAPSATAPQVAVIPPPTAAAALQQPTAAAATAAAAGAFPASTPPAADPGRNSELIARRKVRVTAEIIEAARKARLVASPEQILAGLDTLEALVPGFTPNLDTLKASEWARLAADAPAVASKIILLKTHYPRLDLARVLVAQPKLLLQSPEQLDRSARQVRCLLSRARDMERLLAAEPALMEPRALISVLITVTKWYFLEKDPIEVLEADPELVRRAQDYDVPFEPVYMDENGNWTAPLLNYKEKRTEWQKYIDQTFYKQP